MTPMILQKSRYSVPSTRGVQLVLDTFLQCGPHRTLNLSHHRRVVFYKFTPQPSGRTVHWNGWWPSLFTALIITNTLFPSVCTKSLVIWTYVAVLVSLTITDAASSSLFRRGCQLADSRSYAAFHSWSEVELSVSSWQHHQKHDKAAPLRPLSCFGVVTSVEAAECRCVVACQLATSANKTAMEAFIFLFQLVPTRDSLDAASFPAPD